MKFYPYEPLDNNAGQKKFWEALKEAFKDDPGVAYYRYAIFSKSGRMIKEPDFVMLHRDLGLWVFESKGCYIDNIQEIQGHDWVMTNWFQEHETPVSQVEDAMWALKGKLEQKRQTRGLLAFNFRVVLPFVEQEQWASRKFAGEAGTEDVVVFKNEATPAALKKKLKESADFNPQMPLTEDQWNKVTAFLGGTLPEKEARPIPTGTSSESPIRVVRELESGLKALDDQQQKVAFEVPEGPQRIRGLAGTGKTVLLAKRAAKMHIRHPDWDIGFIFFTQALYDQVLTLISQYCLEMNEAEPDWTKLSVLHAWGSRSRGGFYRKLAEKSGERPKSVSRVKSEIREAGPARAFEYVCDELEKSLDGEAPQLFDALLIDEGQDLPPSCYRLARQSLRDPKRLYWAYDEAQGIGTLIVPRPNEIFGIAPNGAPVVDLGGYRNPDGTVTAPTYEDGIAKAHNLKLCYRTPKAILMAAHAINMGLYRAEGPLQGVTNKRDWETLGYSVTKGDFSPASVSSGATVELTRTADSSPHPVDSPTFHEKSSVGDVLVVNSFNSEEEERDWIAWRVAEDVEQGLDPWDLMITGPIGDYEKSYYKKLQRSLKDRGVSSVIAGVDTNRDIFRQDGAVTISSIFRAKGNEAWKVYACRFHFANTPLSFKEGEQEIHKRNEGFVALTRAKAWCVATGVEGPIMEELRGIKNDFPCLVFPAFNKSSLQRNTDENLEGVEDVDA